MDVKKFIQNLTKLGIETITGIPDSTLKPLCDYINNGGEKYFKNHIVPENEGAAVGIAIGEYLATGRAACIYMQNSGLGNIVNPITSLAHREVYGIPMLFLIGWRGEPGRKDEPQHKFMGRITTDLLDLLEIEYSFMDSGTTQKDLDNIFERAQKKFACNKQFALVIKKGSFEKRELSVYKNQQELRRDDAIQEIVKWMRDDDLAVATTGKISREFYEQMDLIRGRHNQAFLTVGGMGYANMIAYGIAQRNRNHRVICLDGDGAILMHMGGIAVIGKHPVNNLIHICLDNEAHESVGGMPTGAAGIDYYKIAQESGYSCVYKVDTKTELIKTLEEVRSTEQLAFIQIKVAIGSRSDLGRPKESPEKNKREFMDMME